MSFDGGDTVPTATTYITADCGRKWYCRGDFNLAPATALESPCPTYTVFPYDPPDPKQKRLPAPQRRDEQIAWAREVVAEAAEAHEAFLEVSGGADEITLDQYLAWFGLNSSATDDSAAKRRVAVIEKFRLHDVNADGFLTFDEIDDLMLGVKMAHSLA